MPQISAYERQWCGYRSNIASNDFFETPCKKFYHVSPWVHQVYGFVGTYLDSFPNFPTPCANYMSTCSLNVVYSNSDMKKPPVGVHIRRKFGRTPLRNRYMTAVWWVDEF